MSGLRVNQYPGLALIVARAKNCGAGRRLVGGEWLFSEDDLCRFHDLLISTGMVEAAIICEGEADEWRRLAPGSSGPIYDHKADAACDLAALIRASAKPMTDRATSTADAGPEPFPLDSEREAVRDTSTVPAVQEGK